MLYCSDITRHVKSLVIWLFIQQLVQTTTSYLHTIDIVKAILPANNEESVHTDVCHYDHMQRWWDACKSYFTLIIMVINSTKLPVMSRVFSINS